MPELSHPPHHPDTDPLVHERSPEAAYNPLRQRAPVRYQKTGVSGGGKVLLYCYNHHSTCRKLLTAAKIDCRISKEGLHTEFGGQLCEGPLSVGSAVRRSAHTEQTSSSSRAEFRYSLSSSHHEEVDMGASRSWDEGLGITEETEGAVTEGHLPE